nr:hypothetical protein [uncultured Acetatifactor sp.]
MDYGTLSARAVMVSVDSGQVMAESAGGNEVMHCLKGAGDSHSCSRSPDGW